MFLVFSSNIYAVPETTAPSQKSPSSYNPYCWDTHMVDQMLVCSKAHTQCANSCTPLGNSGAQIPCLSECSRILKLCYAQSTADYKVCIEAEKQAQKKQEVMRVSPSKEPATPSPQSDQAEVINDWIKDTFGELDIERIENGVEPERPPAITPEVEQAAEKAQPSGEYLIGIVKTVGSDRALVKYPGAQEFTDMKEVIIPPGSTIRARGQQIAIFTPGKGIILVQPGTEFTIPPTGLLNLPAGTVEIMGQTSTNTEFVDIIVIGTHYWVTHEPGKQTTVGVYEGEIKVKTKDGKTTMVTPSGDKPGVVIITQKLSIVKLVIAVIVLIAIVGGTIIILKKRGDKILRGKKKR